MGDVREVAVPTVRIKRQPLWEITVTAHVGDQVLVGTAQYRARHIEDLMKRVEGEDGDKVWEKVLDGLDWKQLEETVENNPEIITGVMMSIQKVEG